MSKFNTKTISKTKVDNLAGGESYKQTNELELVSILLTSFVGDSFYEKSNDTISRLRRILPKVDPKFAAKAAIFARDTFGMRSITHVLAGELTQYSSGMTWAKNFYDKVVLRPDDMNEILSYYLNNKTDKSDPKFPNSLKKGFASAFNRFDDYQIAKYRSENKEVKLVDIVNLVHPIPNQKNKESLSNLISGDLKSTQTWESMLSEAGQNVNDENELSDNKSAVWETLLKEKKIGYFALLRNLRNIIETAPNQVDTAIKHLTNKEKVLKSRLLPFRFATAYEEIEKLKTTKSSITFESDKNSNVEKVLKALETALEYSVENIPALEGKTAVLIDHSGSVRGDGGGHSKVSAFSKTTTAMIGNLFGSMLTWSQRDVYMGLFGDRLIQVPINRKKGLLEFNKDSFNEGEKCGGGTENGLYIFLDECIKNNTRVDNLVIFSDMVIGDGGRGGWDATSYTGAYGSFQTLFKKFKAINPQCNTICVNIRQTSGKDVFDKSLNVLQIAGWSDKIFNIIEANCKGYSELIKEIEKIEI
jgi:hypothetical protein